MGKKKGCPECGKKEIVKEFKNSYLTDKYVKCSDCKAIYIDGKGPSFYEVDDD